MRKTKKILPGLVILLLALALAVGGVYSYMFDQTEDAANQLIPAAATCEVYEKFENNKKTSITVTNTGKIDAYIRVRLVTYWVNEKNDIVAQPSGDLTVTPTADWMVDEDNDTFYYKKPVKAGEKTPELLTVPLALIQSNGYKQVIEVFAETIQAEGVTDEGNIPAVEDAWGVTLNDEGIITVIN